MQLGVYLPASTANPTGRRPWNSRLLSFYAPNSFALPTTGQGPFLLNPGVAGAPAASGGLGFYRRARFAVPTSSLSGLGQNETQILGVSVDPTLLALGLGAAFLAIYLLGGHRPKRRARRLRKKISRAQSQLRALGAEYA